jgi:hypothetical protein
MGVRARDRSGTAEEGAVRAWLQGVRDDLEQGAAGGITLDLEWRGWLESPHDDDVLATFDTAALAEHAKSLTTSAIGAHTMAIYNCAVASGVTGGDVVARWIGIGGQGGLRCCRHCGSLHLASNAALSHCWGSPSGTHAYDDGDFEVPRGTDGEHHHLDCSSCHALWSFDGHSRGHCPGNPTGHTGGDRYRIASASVSEEVAQWAECTQCQRVIAMDFAHAGCVDSTEDTPVAHVLDATRRLVVGHEEAPTMSRGTAAIGRALGIAPDIASEDVPSGVVGHPRFARRGPVPPLAAAWLAGWLPRDRVAAIGWRPGSRHAVTLDEATPLVQVDAPGGLYLIEIDRRRKLDDDAAPVLALRRCLGRGARSHDGWRACTTCGAAVDTAALGCAAGGIHDFDGAELSVPIDQGYVRAIAGWRRCRKCSALWHHTADEPSVCASGGTHEAESDAAFALRTSEVASGYRACRRCRALVDPANTAAACPAGGVHETRQSPHFILDGVHRRSASVPGWSSCRKCGVIGFTQSVRCAEGAHTFAGDDHTVEPWRLSLDPAVHLVPLRRCEKCRGLFATRGPCRTGGMHQGGRLLPTHAAQRRADDDGRASWRACKACGLLVLDGASGQCVANGKAHRPVGPALVLGGHAFEAARVLVGVGSEVAADRDPFVARLVAADDAPMRVEIDGTAPPRAAATVQAPAIRKRRFRRPRPRG